MSGGESSSRRRILSAGGLATSFLIAGCTDLVGKSGRSPTTDGEAQTPGSRTDQPTPTTTADSQSPQEVLVERAKYILAETRWLTQTHTLAGHINSTLDELYEILVSRGVRSPSNVSLEDVGRLRTLSEANYEHFRTLEPHYTFSIEFSALRSQRDSLLETLENSIKLGDNQPIVDSCRNLWEDTVIKNGSSFNEDVYRIELSAQNSHGNAIELTWAGGGTMLWNTLYPSICPAQLMEPLDSQTADDVVVHLRGVLYDGSTYLDPTNQSASIIQSRFGGLPDIGGHRLFYLLDERSEGDGVGEAIFRYESEEAAKQNYDKLRNEAIDEGLKTLNRDGLGLRKIAWQNSESPTYTLAKQFSNFIYLGGGTQHRNRLWDNDDLNDLMEHADDQFETNWVFHILMGEYETGLILD